MIWAIFKKELKQYFITPISMALLPAFCAYCNFQLYSGMLDYMKLTTAPERKTAGFEIWDFIAPTLFSNIHFVLSLIIPILTMRLVAEERKTHTFDLMISLPIKPFQYIFGKYLAALSFSTILLCLTMICPLALSFYTQIDWISVSIIVLGLFFYCMFYIAAGVFFSTITSNQFIAGILTIGFSFSFAVIGWLAYISPPEIEKILNALLINTHVKSFFEGYIFSSDITLFLSVTALFLYLAQRRVIVEYPSNS